MVDSVDFVELKELFDPQEWDIAYVSPENFKKGGHKPVKAFHHLKGVNWGKNPNAIAYNGIILARYTTEVNNYALYDEAASLLDTKYKHSYGQVYLNFKEVALLSGFGHRARNSLIYNRKFGFQCKFCAYMFVSPIINYEELEPSTQLLDLCEGCDDCIKNCPVGAIHDDWVDQQKCEDFIVCGNHPTITSKKWFWYEKMRPNYSKEEVESWHTYDWDKTPRFNENQFWGKGVDGFYEEAENCHLKKDGVVIEWPSCHECQKQPRCSKAPINKEVSK